MVNPTIRKVGSLFFLGIFLWFNSVKDFHDVEHADDLHCHVKNARHFHNQEHHCPICDYVFPYYDKVTGFEMPSLNYCAIGKFLTIEQSIALFKIPSLPSRGPPKVA
jgi:hypothetical protein